MDGNDDTKDENGIYISKYSRISKNATLTKRNIPENATECR